MHFKVIHSVRFFTSILKAGLSHIADPIDRRRLIFFNYLILFCAVTALLLAMITLMFGFVTQAIVCFLGMFLVTLAFKLNQKGFFDFSKYFFLALAAILIFTGTFINMQRGYYVESENMLFALMATTMFLLDGKRKHYAYWIIFSFFITLKVTVASYELDSYGLHFWLVVINSCIVGFVIYAFLAAFRSILVRALDRNVQNERRLFSMIDNVPVFLALVDKKGNYVLANEKYASNFRVSKRELVGKNRDEILPAKLVDDQKEFFERASKGESVSFLQETVLPNGTTISANGKYEPVIGENGEVESITICVDDVTPLIKAQEALKIANETKDKLFSIIAHDIKSPLNMFQTFLNVSEQANMSAKEFFEYQQLLKSRLDSLTGTVDELLEWSRMQLGGINAYPAMVNVSALVNENVDLFDSLIKKKNIDFKVNTPPEISAWIDENHIKVALRNLIHNAIKFTNGGGRVEVYSDQNEQETIIKVSDSGVGMDSGTIDSIIKKEIQNSQVGTEREMGTGLGLSLSIGLLEKNNCEISVESEIDKGTSFEIKIPRQGS